ncbi:hypothetical protein EVAR_85727_1 [Eumeta japonica]|uniref:(+)RNA virus helicase C-terminal domain-containing protein n=1 Tax=Eumeta variegata TaxID=151549 RepID=A0A4C1Y5X8_EUMVA|nr:hypothetical protein EVAR_85727_1 [Eumeta japonica]
MKCKVFDTLSLVEVGGNKCRIVRTKNKTILLFSWEEKTPFSHACSLLSSLRDSSSEGAITLRTISVDAMSVSSETDLIKVDTGGYSILSEGSSGFERFQQHIAEHKKTELEESRQRAHKEKSESQRRIHLFLGALGRAVKGLPRAKSLQGASTSKPKRKKPKVPIDPKIAPIRAQKGEVDPPVPITVRQLRDHYVNAFSEFIRFIELSSKYLKVLKVTCQGILGLYLDESEARLTAALEDAEAAIYENDSQTIVKGKMSTIHMAAYSATSDLMALDEEQTERMKRPNIGKWFSGAEELRSSDHKRGLTSHFGAIVMATRLAGAKEDLLIGNVNQLPFIDRLNHFKMECIRPNLVVTVSKKLLCTNRNPMNVAYALNEVEKESYIAQGFGKGGESRVLTIHEAQGLTFDGIVIVPTTAKQKL